ncbi:hypothetical protein K1T71_000755 [Dendrolimus kikuchii]|uniref:Uncharacterized protein n=1 Tax=Dendrolimus kikuchii TaxID=765133 RepID=A0ACC1DKU1_9NEOP|nr:hypothetical protein K1T71_000755 [Dendrolimus kikuchii]
MFSNNFLLILGFIVHIQTTLAVWSCIQDSDCSVQSGSICLNGNCRCPTGQQSVLSGSRCADVAPYFTSSCLEDHQCSRIFGPIVCRDANSTRAGACFCQPGHHYFLGRCWPSIDYGEFCTRDEECIGVLKDPYNMKCEQRCTCADGYYTRQRGECRKIGAAVGDGCVIDEDCQFEGGVCNAREFMCYDINAPSEQVTTTSSQIQRASKTEKIISKQSRQACDITNLCSSPFECSTFGVCVCPVGYYSSDDGNYCLAELGSPSIEEQCVGLFAEVRNGVCTCHVNFYFEENMRDCVKATTSITDSCVTDSNCHTFGTAARCGDPQLPWGLRNCECIPELAVWDANRKMCRLFAGIGEACEVDSDCLAGELEIQCIADATGQGYCTCPEGLLAVDGLCLTTGLELGDSCQADAECTGTPNTVCSSGRCSCGSGYQEAEGVCAPIIGGICVSDSDCVIANTVCQTGTDVSTCQCDNRFVEYDDECWPVVDGFGSRCNVTLQCIDSMGDASSCTNGYCVCLSGYHYRDGTCWLETGLFESCTSHSQCYLGDISDRVVCRNSLCQCDFNYPYSEELHTCLSTGSSATSIFVSFTSISASILLVILS